METRTIPTEVIPQTSDVSTSWWEPEKGAQFAKAVAAVNAIAETMGPSPMRLMFKRLYEADEIADAQAKQFAYSSLSFAKEE